MANKPTSKECEVSKQNVCKGSNSQPKPMHPVDVPGENLLAFTIYFFTWGSPKLKRIKSLTTVQQHNNH
ncbi:hypothetical protein OUZ56_015273 [Daphnia magna]|uniref:Uncharacterized protein n=1 Tax=Daphnia magna TaxID=35525 RepID=A0ABR0AMP7_9CRUS|nr:hypothetical protein OUZ56_015273 [Daphnia magna]